MSTNRRLKRLEREARGRTPGSSGRSEAMKRLLEHLDRVVAARRGELSQEEEARVWATNAVLRERMAQIRGEGGR